LEVERMKEDSYTVTLDLLDKRGRVRPLDEITKEYFKKIYEILLSDGQAKTEIAKVLGISRATLYRKLKKYRIKY
jgi:DNA-binding NtrC family response regulator